MYVIKLTINPSPYCGFPTAYAIIDDLDLHRLSNLGDTSMMPGLMYHLTKNGGIYAIDDTTIIESRVCCSTGDIKKNLFNYLYNNRNVEITHSANLVSRSLFNSLKKSRFNTIVTNLHFCDTIDNTIDCETGRYQISIWSIDLEFCLCDCYRTTIFQEINGNTCAYIRHMGSPLKMKRKEMVRIKNKFRPMIESLK